MKETIQHPTYGEIVYSESFWTSKRTLTVNGIEAKPVSKKEFEVDGKTVILKGNYLSGLTLFFGAQEVKMIPPSKWYELLLAMFPLIFLLIWGNNPTACMIFPVIGGAIGGAIGGVSAITSLYLMKRTKSVGYKILIGMGVLIATILIAFLLALAILYF